MTLMANSSQIESEHRSGYQAFAENQRRRRDLVEAIPWVLDSRLRTGSHLLLVCAGLRETVRHPATTIKEPMVKTWQVRLELARDDNGSLSDEGIKALTDLLAERNAKPVVTRGESGTVLVQMTIDARDDMAARSAAEAMLREGANTVWSALGLPPFTIAFVDATKSRP